MKTEKFVESSTKKGTFYKVTSETIIKKTCSCNGFIYRGKCKHIEEI